MESVVESAFVKCTNAEFGCTQNVTYGKESTTHEKECSFAQCSCPALNCNYTCSYKKLYKHYRSIHKGQRYSGCLYVKRIFSYGDIFKVDITNVIDKILIKTASSDHRMFVVQCFKEACCVSITVSCIAPNAPEIGDFSCLLSYTSFDVHILTFQIPKVKKILKVSFETPQENVMMIPNSLLSGESLKVKVCINKL